MKTILTAFIILFFTINTIGQSQFQNTIFLKENQKSPKATLEDIKWIAGHWRGEAFGGITEGVWTPPLGGSMMSAFKVVQKNKVSFYEILTIVEENGSLILRLKHFHPDLKGWEEKTETIDFKLVKITPNKVFFNGYTFEKVSDNEINEYVVIDMGGEKKEMKFNFKGVSK